MSAQMHEEILAHGALSYPYEGCGLLIGQVVDGHNHVEHVQPVNNVWPVEDEKRERFRISEDDWRDVELTAMGSDLDIIGIFHSHPDCEPVASARDLGWASWPGYSYIITGVNGGQPAASRSWQLKEDRSGFVEEQIELA
jgi:proteasome lid subunit RPN8/RPN11